MINKITVVLLMLIMVPAFAFAGTYSIAVSGSGGSVGPAPLSGYATAAKVFTATATAGYTLSSVTDNSVNVTTNSSYVTGSGPWTITVPLSSTSQTFYVSFKQNVQVAPTLTAVLPSGITIPVNTPTLLSGANSTIANLQTGTQATFTFSGAGLTFNPVAGQVTTPAGIATNVTAAASGTYTATLALTAPNATPSSANITITVQPPGIAASSYCLSCHNGWAEANAYAGSPHAASVNGPSCQSCHNPGLALPHPGYSISGTTANPGLYYSCVTCHYTGSNIVTAWPPPGFSFHTAYSGTNQCTQCHDPHTTLFNGNLPYPHFSTYSTAQFVTTNISCNNCHNSLVDNSFHIYSANTQWATSGHANPVSPAYIGPGPYTEANLEAYDFKFLGTPLPATPANTVSNDCVRCHSTTGFINYITPTNPANSSTAFQDIHAWGTLGDRTREMVACSACHNNTTGFDATFSRRSVGIPDSIGYDTSVVQAWYNYSSAATGKIIRSKQFVEPAGNEYADSNICFTCHSGKSAGNLIKQTQISGGVEVCSNSTLFPSIVCGLGNGNVTNGLNNAFWSNVSFIDPHGMASINIMYPDQLRGGYEYRPGSSVITYHLNINLGTTQGPCVGCHMTAPNKHVFSPVSSASNGVITAITTNICSSCHTNGPGFTINGAADLETKREGYQAALTVITTQLAAYGVFFNPALPPYFFTTSNTALQNNSTQVTNWNAAAGSIGGQGANLMGAAFNLRLFSTDAGWVHNGTTSKRLLYDTIDYLDDGNPNNNTVAVTIQNLAGLDQTTKNNATSYLIPRP